MAPKCRWVDHDPALGLVLFYLVGWMLIGMRSRLDTYAGLLEASMLGVTSTEG